MNSTFNKIISIGPSLKRNLSEKYFVNKEHLNTLEQNTCKIKVKRLKETMQADLYANLGFK